MELKVDPEFKAAIQPLAQEELAQLEANIKANGCRDPLVIWDGVIIDGHHRYEICTRLDIPFQTVPVDFPDKEAALDWMDANQLGRRNLTPDAFKLLLGRRYNRVKKTHGGDRKSSGQLVHLNSGDASASPEPERACEALAVEHGVSEKTVRRAAKFAEEVEKTPALQKAIAEKKPVIQAKREIKEAQREERREENRTRIEQVKEPSTMAAAGARFATILMDPPWDWGDENDGDQMGRARPDYGTMSLQQLMDLPVQDLADADCHLYLWITNRSLPKGFALLEKWGFRYVTCVTWCKPSFGMGNYFRGQTEQILFGVKGSQPLKRKDVGTCLHAPRGPQGHSSKPTEIYDLVESCSPGPYLEMFARSNHKDWTAWGAEADESAA